MADPKLVRIWMLFGTDNFTHDHATKCLGRGLRTVYFQSCHGHLEQQLVTVQGWVHPLAQPCFTEFHRVFLMSCLVELAQEAEIVFKK